MIEQIKQWFLYREFKVIDKSQKSAVSKVNSGNKISILFNGTSEDDRKIIHKFKKVLNPSGQKNIKSLAFIDNTLPLDNVDYDAYNNINLKWYGLPFGPKIDEFIHQHSDIFVVLCERMLPHYEYIIAHANADFIIGPNIDKSEKYFNLIIDTLGKPGLQTLIDKIILNTDKISVK
ncbi:MAG: hypothetical protein IPO92_13715 [Saprospiraceae bacterium]|nr:hypothetical protein [Saprospiraceae bacterium]